MNYGSVLINSPFSDPQCDSSDSDVHVPVSSEPALGISKKEILKTKKKKVELSAKAQLKKITRKDLEALPLLSESISEESGDCKRGEVVKQVSTKNKHSKKSTSDEHCSSTSKLKEKRSKEKSKVQDIAEDKIPLLSTGAHELLLSNSIDSDIADSQTIEVKNKSERSTKNKHSKKSASDEHSSSTSKLKEKRLKKKSGVQDIAEDKIPLLSSSIPSERKPKNKTASVLIAKRAKPKVKLQESMIVDERREKRNEARRLRRQKRKVSYLNFFFHHFLGFTRSASTVESQVIM